MNNDAGVIEKIIAIEWEMFVSVNEGAALASCQEDKPTFTGMRKAQFSAWSRDAARSYLSDLELAQASGRNLLAEKYIHMMSSTEPTVYKALISAIPAPTEEARKLAAELSDLLLEQTRELFESYPHVAGQGRPLYSSQDSIGTSVETYQHGELLTFSENTLRELKAHALALEKAGMPLARIILENTVGFYGYDSLESAEETTRALEEEHEGGAGPQ